MSSPSDTAWDAVHALRAADVSVTESAQVLGISVERVRELLDEVRLPPVLETDPELLPAEGDLAVSVPTVPSRDPDAWPPLPDESTVWGNRRVYTTWPQSKDVRVRMVRLWGREVEINERDEVWCPHCSTFIAAEVLGSVDNVHPVGIKRSGGIFWFNADPRATGGGGSPDPMRVDPVTLLPVRGEDGWGPLW